MNAKIYTKILKNFLIVNKLIKRTIQYKIERKLISDKFATRLYRKKIYNLEFRSQLDSGFIKISNSVNNKYLEVYKHYKVHEFNLLGTGWLKWQSGNNILGFMGIKYNSTIPELKSNCLIKTMTSNEYIPIAWNFDVKTGYEFTSQYFNSDLISRLPDGVDIKVPWEIGRMYHWPQLAIIAINNSHLREEILNEFIYQMTDFMISNPVGTGVQFYCAMEIGIRAINLLIAFDLLKQLDEYDILNNSFNTQFQKYLYLHGRIIIQNLEYDYINKKSGNHYLSDLCGLLWICLYFPTKEAGVWMKIIENEFQKAISIQFLQTGCNFECSSAYHRLASELSVLGIIASIKYHESYILSNRMEQQFIGMYHLLNMFKGMDGNIIQIGDNDSGRVLKAVPEYNGDIENTLTVDFVVSLFNNIFCIDTVIKDEVAESLVKALGVFNYYNRGIRNKKEKLSNYQMLQPLKVKDNVYHNYRYKEESVIKLHDDSNFSNIMIVTDSSFGLIKVVGYNVELYIRTIPEYKLMNLAHAHDDVFHYELCMNGERYFADKGSYVYTSSDHLRTYYSSSSAHNVPIHNETILKRTSMFAAESKAIGHTKIKNNCIIIEVINNDIVHMRKFIIESSRIIILDYSNKRFRLNVTSNEISYGYGQKYVKTYE